MHPNLRKRRGTLTVTSSPSTPPPKHHQYTAFILATLSIACLMFCVYLLNRQHICLHATQLPTQSHASTHRYPNRYRGIFKHLALTPLIRPPHHRYVACMLTAQSIACLLFCLYLLNRHHMWLHARGTFRNNLIPAHAVIQIIIVAYLCI